MKKMVRGIAVALCLASALFCMVACQPADDVIRKGLTQELDELKNFDKAVYDKYGFDQAVTSQFEMLGIEGYDFMQAYLAGFDYEIGEITVDGDKADVELTMKMRSSSDIESSLTSMMSSLDPAEFEGMSQDQVYKEFGKRFMDMLKSGEIPVTSQTVHVEGVKEGNVWNFEAGMEKAVASLMMG